MTANNTVAGMFNIVAAEEIPTKIRRGGRGRGQWAEAVGALRGLEVGQALSLQVAKPSVASTRQNMIQANRTHGQGMELVTRTRPAVDKDGNELVDDEGNPMVEIFFIKNSETTADAASE